MSKICAYSSWIICIGGPARLVDKIYDKRFCGIPNVCLLLRRHLISILSHFVSDQIGMVLLSDDSIVTKMYKIPNTYLFLLHQHLHYLVPSSVILLRQNVDTTFPGTHLFFFYAVTRINQTQKGGLEFPAWYTWRIETFPKTVQKNLFHLALVSHHLGIIWSP